MKKKKKNRKQILKLPFGYPTNSSFIKEQDIDVISKQNDVINSLFIIATLQT